MGSRAPAARTVRKCHEKVESLLDVRRMGWREYRGIEMSEASRLPDVVAHPTRLDQSPASSAGVASLRVIGREAD